jgi:hypothetical protein
MGPSPTSHASHGRRQDTVRSQQIRGTGGASCDAARDTGGRVVLGAAVEWSLGAGGGALGVRSDRAGGDSPSVVHCPHALRDQPLHPARCPSCPRCPFGKLHCALARSHANCLSYMAPGLRNKHAAGVRVPLMDSPLVVPDRRELIRSTITDRRPRWDTPSVVPKAPQPKGGCDTSLVRPALGSGCPLTGGAHPGPCSVSRGRTCGAPQIACCEGALDLWAAL